MSKHTSSHQRSQHHYTRDGTSSEQTTTGGGWFSGGGGRGKDRSRGDDGKQRQPDETVFVPPAWIFILGGIGFLVGLVANLWQLFTSFSAFQTIFITGPIYTHMIPADQAKALPIINIICALISVSFQLAILFMVFRIERAWKETRARGQGNKLEAAKHTAIEVMQQVPLVLIWGALGFIADAIGDYTFISLYSDNWFILFMYGASLYASSTLMLVRSIEYLWAGVITWEKWKAYKASLYDKQHSHDD